MELHKALDVLREGVYTVGDTLKVDNMVIEIISGDRISVTYPSGKTEIWKRDHSRTNPIIRSA